MKIEKKYFAVLLIFMITAGTVAAHPYYVSICQIEFNRETHSLEISLKTFADDLLMGLENAGHKEVFLGEERENPKTDQFIFEYVQTKLKFEVNGKPVEYKFIGKEMEDAVLWSYYEITDIDDLQMIDVQCNLLTEIYDTQSNLIQVEKNKKIKNLLLSNKTTTGELLFRD